MIGKGSMTKNEYIQLEKEIKAKQCCLAKHFDGEHCSEGTISSHSISKSKQLKIIAEDGKVYAWNNDPSYCFHLMDESNGLVKTAFTPRLIGKASTFKGFCNYHDRVLFNLIDKPIVNFDNETILQLHYRAMSYECFHKKVSNELLERALSDSDFCYNPLYGFCDAYRDRDIIAFKDVVKEKDVCEKAFATKKANNEVKAVIYRFDTVAPVMCTAGFVPAYTIDNEKELFKEDLTSSAPLIGSTLGIDANNKSFWALTFTNGDDCNIQGFIKSLEKYLNKRFLDIAVLFCLQKSQNACCRPSWYNGLQEWRKKIINRNINELLENRHERVVGVNLLNQKSSVCEVLTF